MSILCNAIGTVDLWRRVGLFVYSHVKLKRQPTKKELAIPSHKPSSENGMAEEGVRSIEVVANGQCENTREGSQLEEEVVSGLYTVLSVTHTDIIMLKHTYRYYPTFGQECSISLLSLLSTHPHP